MCVNNNFYPLVLNKETGKKKIIFNLPYAINNRNDLENLKQYADECKNACIGISDSMSLSRYLSNKHYEFQKLVSVPCGVCEDCLKRHAKDWAIRIIAETKAHQSNYFVTLTYDDEHLPINQMLDTKAISNFNKKLKVYLSRKNLKSDFRFFGVGEYGSTTFRPHYHVIYFGLDIPDLEFYKLSENGDVLYTSKFLSSIWSAGFVVVGEVSAASACYVARYCDKKKTLSSYEKKKLKASGFVPEFNVMSRRPGIGANFTNDVVDSVVSHCYTLSMKGLNASIPMFYKKKLKNDYLSSKQLDIYQKHNDFLCSLGIAESVARAEENGKTIISNNISLDREKKEVKRKRGF